MSKSPENNALTDEDTRNIILIDKIYQSFEALEDTLGKLKLEEPLFITYMAKKCFLDKVYDQIKHYREKIQTKKYLN